MDRLVWINEHVERLHDYAVIERIRIRERTQESAQKYTAWELVEHAATSTSTREEVLITLNSWILLSDSYVPDSRRYVFEEAIRVLIKCE